MKAARPWGLGVVILAAGAAAAACNALVGVEPGKLKLCTDGIQNGDEAGVDCGGYGCAPCEEPSPCDAAGGCGPSTCDDGVQSGDETGVDCGGSCPACGAGTLEPACSKDQDCAAGVCVDGVCRCSELGMILGDGFCIDAFEVTNKRYAAFLQQSPPVAGQVAECAANIDYGSAPPADDRPVVNVDWCDARAFCAWDGKRLCRGELLDPASAAKSEWYLACSRAGNRAYPYGDAFDADACNGSGSAKDVLPVTDKPLCEGGIPGLFHMSGNAAEWEDACDPIGACRVRGGSFSSKKPEDAACAADRVEPRLLQASDIGFRCCSDG